MAFSEIVESLYQNFVEQSADAKLILLHASGRYRSALLSRLLSADDMRVFYYAMGNDDVDIESFIAGFTHDMADQAPHFGAHIDEVGVRNLRDLRPLATAFINDLVTLSDRPFLLILDEYDRADIGDSLQSFLELVLEDLPPQCKIVINSRSLPRLPWMALIAQKKAIMLSDAQLIGDNFYENQTDPSQARLLIKGFGPGSVTLDGEVVTTWEGHLPRLLFFFALERPVVTRSEICDAFWPELGSEQAVNVFHVTKRRLHKALEAAGTDILVHDDGYYRINPELSIHYDVVDFVSALVEGRMATTVRDQVGAWQRAIELCQKPFLQGHTESWIVRRRHEYQQGYLEALAAMAKIRVDEDRPEHALQLLLKAVNENPLRQDLHRQIMMLYTEMGRRSEAVSHYNKLREELDKSRVALEADTIATFKELSLQ